MPSYLPWNEDLETLLLHCIIVKGSHVAQRSKTRETWSEVADMFFSQPETASLKEIHYKGAESIRRLRDKYALLISSIQKDIETGNQSGKEGDLSQLYQHANQIISEIEMRSRLNNIGKEVIAGVSNPHKRKLLSGEIVDNTKSSRPTPPSMEEQFMAYLAPQKEKDQLYAAEEEFEVKFKEWIAKSNKTIENLLDDAEIQGQSDRDDVADIRLKVLISIYCERGASFSGEKFKNELLNMDIPQKVCSKLYTAIQDWRREFQKFRPPLATPSYS
jgi:hypothetical protein